jgi:type I restriction enzyme S subunit
MSLKTIDTAFEGNALPAFKEVKLKEIVTENCLGGNYQCVADVTPLPVMKMGNLGRGTINLGKIEYVSDGKILSDRDVLNKGDILFNTRNTLDLVGKVAMWRGELEQAVFNSNIMRITFSANVLNEYMNYYFNSYSALKQLRARATGTTSVAAIYWRDCRNIRIPLPPLSEQKAIADLLSTWDEAIEKTERLIQVKEKQLRQMSRWLLFGHKRLGNQKNELADGHFFKYPSDWALVKIGKVAKEVSARNGESEETVLSCSKYDGFVNSLDYFGKQVFSSDTSNYKVVKKEQFGYPSNHVEEGSIGLLEHCEKGIVSPIYVVFEASKEKVHSPYLYKLLKTDIYRHIFQVSTSSSVDRRGSLRWGDFSKIKVLIPSLEEQLEISETLSSAQHEIDLLKQLADKYKTQKRGLMQKMLTGKWRVKPEIVNQFMEA